MVFSEFKQKIKKGKVGKKLKYNLKVFLLLVGIVMLWRGLWNIMEVYLLPGNFLLSNIVCIVIGLAIIYFDEDNDLEDVL